MPTRVNLNGINELDLILSGTVTTSTTGGVTTITQTGGSGVDLEVNGTPNVVQTLLNLIDGFGVSVTDQGSGDVSVESVTHSEPLTDGSSNFIFAAGDIIVVVGVAN